jgi:hypothetical protein
MPTNDKLNQDPNMLANAMFNVDTMININKKPQYPYFSPTADPTPAFKERDKLECKKVGGPRGLKFRKKDETVACGWYYYDDDNKRGFATLGTEKGPIDKDFLTNNPGGQWMWNIFKAQKMEDLKKCRKITSCENSDIIPRKCGWCSTLNKGIPMLKNGKSKYPNDPNLNCDGSLYSNPASCPKPPKMAKTILTDKGKLLKSGDIYNGVEIPFVDQKSLCEASSGKLSETCLISIAKTVGFSEFGVLVKVLDGDADGYYTKLGPNFDTMRIVKRIFETEANYKLKGPLFGDGAISRAEVLNAYRNIFKLVTSSPSKRVRNAAKWLVEGKDFDPCDYEPNKIGPFEPLCQERIALDAGCQRDGYKFPGPDSYANNNLLKWSVLTDFYNKLFQAVNSNNPIEQRKAALDCLGITIASDAAVLCGEPGTPCRVLSEAEIQRNTAVVSAQTNIDTYRQAIPEAKTPIEKKLANELYEQAIQLKTQVLDKIRRINKCPPNPPVACWDFYLERLDDRMQKYKSSRRGKIEFATLGGKKCAHFKGRNNINIKDLVSTKDFKSITAMVYVNKETSNFQFMWNFMNKYDGSNWNSDIFYGGVQYNGSASSVIFDSKQGGDGPSVRGPFKYTTGKWVHLAWVIDEDYMGMTAFVDGASIGRWSDPRNPSLKGRQFKDNAIMRTPFDFTNDTGVAWFRMFDYTMNAEALKMDMKNSWILPPMPPLPPNVDEYTYEGCFGDCGPQGRALPVRLGNVREVEDCYTQARNKNFKKFGLQYYGECWVGNENDDAKRYGPRDDVGCGELGSGCTNQVYTIGK